MSLRGTKRGSGARADEPSTSKRRRIDQEDALWQLRPVSDLKMSSIYNRSASDAPAELFRKDLISAMKLPDNEPLNPSEYWVITDSWKQDWERGVQVPVNPDSLPAPKVKIIKNPRPPNFQEFKLPRDKYIHLSRDIHYQSDKHFLSTTPARAEAACSYDLDASDTAWLKLLNAERARAGALPVTEDQLEKVVEELEIRTWDKIQTIMKSEEGLGIEYDENVICDVCRSPDSEDGNEMVFCDSCNICVHQACYGITVIPEGQWLCRPCGDGVRPTCVLCPNQGGAMKCTPTGHKWAHVSCVLWIPEVSIGCAEKMEPITKISSIPTSRWSLLCVLCRERKGACIQCSVKSCKTAYHVTCAFKYGLEMRAIIEDENADDGVKLRSYCQKHSVNSKKEKCPGSGSDEEEVKRKRRKDMTSEEKTQARAARLSEIEKEFDKHVSVKDISTNLLDVDQDAIQYIYNYWKLKRRAGHNRPLLPPKSDDTELLTHRQEQADLDKMKMFVQLRQDLERVRNLCYMVSRREKLSRSFFRMREQTFHKQIGVLSSGVPIPETELSAIIEANHGPSIYDKLYSHPNATDHKNDFELLLSRIAPPESGDERKKDRNGLVKRSKSANPYKKHYVNGSRRSGSMYSGLSSEESEPEMNRSTRYRGRAIGSSTDDDAKKSTSSPKKKVSPKAKGKRSPKKAERQKKKVPKSKALVESSSEDELVKSALKKDSSRSKTLQQMEKEMTAGKVGQSGTDSDELMPIRSTRNNKFPIDIYSDSSEDAAEKKSDLKSDKIKNEKVKTEKSPDGNDSQQSLPRTKAAMKEFIPTQPEKKVSIADDKPAPKKRGRKPSNKDKKPPIKSESDYEAKNKENIKLSKSKENPTDLIVPQRQAAKKASENMRSNTVIKKEETPTPEKQPNIEEVKSKVKIKAKDKDTKEQPIKSNRIKSKGQEKESISYVPQRQAAKKAAAHIKSGLGTKSQVAEADSDKKKDNEKPETSKISPKKDEEKTTKTLEEGSSSSSSNSSSSSYSSSSSSEEEHDKPEMKPTAKAREIKPILRHKSVFSPPGTRPTVDLPFLDKVSRPLSSTSASSESESSKNSDRSGSDSPSPKRPRRRRKGKSISVDVSPRKAPDKKLKTSERGSECGVSSPLIEREEPRRLNDTCATTRSRTRSTTASGDMSDKLDARSRKSSKDIASAPGSNKTPKESDQPSELSTSERKTYEEIKIEIKEEIPSVEPVDINEDKSVSNNEFDNVSGEIKDKNNGSDISTPNKMSPKFPDAKKFLLSRRMSVKETSQKEVKSSSVEIIRPITKARRLSVHGAINATTTEQNSISPVKKLFAIEKPVLELNDKTKTPIDQNDNFNGNNKDWLPKAPSPTEQLAPVEKPGGDEKYMTEDKLLDFDPNEKSSVRMIAKIQANLNENTMIKSPKTPMDARTIDPIEIENPMVRYTRKRSILDPDRKYINKDASHVQGVEISKSAKIPSAVNQYPNRSMFSPPTKENELFDYEMVAIDEGFNHDEIMKPFAAYPEIFFKEDTKEQGVRETLNLVDRLRLQLSSKKVPTENSAQIELDVVNVNKAERDEGNNSYTPKSEINELVQDVPQQNENVHDIYNNQPPPNEHPSVNHTSFAHPGRIMPINSEIDDNKEYKPIPMTSHVKWMSAPPSIHVPHNDIHMTREVNFEHVNSYNEEIKELPTLQSDAQSVSELADTISLSKQSDDSEPISVVDHELTLDHQNYENNNSLIHSDCATISSPYIPQESSSKWGESKIASRRSSTSSTASENSSNSSIGYNQHISAHNSRQITLIPNIDSYPPIPAYSCPVEPSMPLNQYSTYPDSSPFVGSMLFAGSTAQLSMPSPGPPLYTPGLAYTNASFLPPKPSFSLCAAFTSSSQNMAITTAMISSPIPKDIESPRDEIDVTGSDKFLIHVASSPSPSTDSFDVSNRNNIKTSNDSNETLVNFHNQDSKSPKSTKFATKFSVKSPAISPKQNDGPKGSKRSVNKSSRSQRGRGRSKSRGQSVHVYHPLGYVGNSIQSKLVGTVYDFDEEIANDGVDLKSLRDRRKSIDLCKSVEDRKSENSSKDASQSPRNVSPLHYKNPSLVESNATNPLTLEPPERLASSNHSPTEHGAEFAQMHTMLPGPVDMRTYQTLDTQTPVVEDNHNNLMSLETRGAERPSNYIDQEMEKQHHTNMNAATTATTPLVPPATVRNEPPTETVTQPLPKVSLSDSRNQLKVKIKGPFLDANYSANNTQPVAPPPVAPVPETNTNSVNTSSAPNTTAPSGSTSLRRMRKKELLRQYWTQSMTIDEAEKNKATAAAPPPVAPTPIARTVITIPKAVTSMTSIPTREDYIHVEPPVEKKKRKVTSGLSRELRHLEVSMNDDVDTSDDVKLSTIAKTNSKKTHKKRGRAATKTNKTNNTNNPPTTPKLKIKIGNNTVQRVHEEPSNLQDRPPKKRIIHAPPTINIEDIRRENMKFRRKIMADFEENEKEKEIEIEKEKEKEKKSKPSKSEKRKKKKSKKTEKLQVVNSENDNSSKLILRIKRNKCEDEKMSVEPIAGPSNAAVVVPEPTVDPFVYDPTARDPLAIDTPSCASEASTSTRKICTEKVSPIRLKLSRSPHGNGYVMKNPDEIVANAPAETANVASSSVTVNDNKHCEVR